LMPVSRQYSYKPSTRNNKHQLCEIKHKCNIMSQITEPLDHKTSAMFSG